VSNNPSIPTAQNQGSTPSPGVQNDGGGGAVPPLGSVEIAGTSQTSSTLIAGTGVSLLSTPGGVQINSTAQAGSLSGTLAQRPAVPSTGTGTLYFATDTGVLFIWNGAAWVPYQSSNWSTVLDLDFTAQASQSLAANGNFTIGGLSWQRENAANDRVAMALTNGTGVVIQPTTSDYTVAGGTTRTAPLLWLPLSALNIPSLDWTTGLRVWIAISGETSVADTGHGFFTGVDDNAAGWWPGYGKTASNGFGTRLLRCGNLGSVGGAEGSNGGGAFANNGVPVMRVDVLALYKTQTVMFPASPGTAPWPSPGAILPNVAANNFQASLTPITQAVGAEFGIVLGAFAAGPGDQYRINVTRIRVDAKT
jgi:hypothetical protein